MAAAGSSPLQELFVYSHEQHQQLSLPERLDRERASRGITIMDWACNHIRLNCQGRLVDQGLPLLAIDFPVRVCWQGSEILQNSTSTDETGQAEAWTPHALSADNSSNRLVRAQASDPLSVSVNMVKLGRPSQNLQRYLQTDWRTRQFYVTLQNPGGPGAQLISREEHREAIKRELTANGVRLQGQIVFLSEMRPRNFIVADEFQTAFDDIIARKIRGNDYQVRPKLVATVHVPLDFVDLTQTDSDEDSGVPHSFSGSSAQQNHRSHPYPISGSLPSTPSNNDSSNMLHQVRSEDDVPTSPGHVSSAGEGPTSLDQHNINNRAAHSNIIVARGFIVVVLPTCSEGSGLTASTSQVQGMNHRRARRHRDDDGSQTVSDRGSLPSLPNTLPSLPNTQSTAHSLSLEMRLDLGSQE